MAPPPLDPLDGGGERWIAPILILSWVVVGAIATLIAFFVGCLLVWGTRHV